MFKNLIFVSLLGIFSILFGCDGDKGDIGPVGPKGDTGATGAKGDSGVAGQDGIGALMFSSGPVKSYKGGYVLGKSNLTAADSILLSNSAVFVYVKSQERWWAQPGIVRWDNNVFTTYGVYNRILNTRFYVVLDPLTWSEQQDTAPDRDFQDIRVVIVPTENYRLNASADWSNYEEVVSTLGLKESDVMITD